MSIAWNDLAQTAGEDAYDLAAGEPVDRTPVSFPQDAPDAGDVAAKVIIGPRDDREPVPDTRTAPYSGIARLHLRWRNNPAGGIGTGFFIGPRVLATAGHNLDHPEFGKVTDIVVVPAALGGVAPFGAYNQAQWWVPKAYSDHHRAEDDWGTIKLQQPVGEKCGFFGMALFNGGYPAGFDYELAGYPTDRSGNRQYTNGGGLEQVSQERLFYLFDSEEGMSGAPVFFKHPGGIFAIGIHSGRPAGPVNINAARRIHGDVFQTLKAAVNA